MCGIAGAIGAVDQAVIQAVTRMNDALIHRGPDDQGAWQWRDENSGRGVAFAHRRLAIIDLSPEAAQPMIDEKTGAVLVFNGEIYNFQLLRRRLEAEGAAFRTRCDAEVLLEAYGRWGADCVRRFRGMFAFAIWDPRSRTVFFARDRLGIKPLYYTQLARPGGAALLFASEVRALLASDLVERRLGARGLASYVWNGFVIGPDTIIAGVRLLPAGTTMTVSLDGEAPRPQRFWSLPQPPQTTRDPGALAETLSDSVRCRLVSDVPLGVFLSGGVDSSAVTALAVRNASAAVRTFNISFEEDDFDESRYARAVADALGTEHTEVHLTQQHFRDQLDDALGSIDQPTFDAINTYFVSRAVREAGITVALAGTGGDELFGGYTSFVDLPRAARWGRRAALVPETPLRALAALVTRLMTGRYGEVGPQTRWGKLGDALAARGRLLDLYQISYGLFTTDFYRRLLGNPPDSAAALGMPSEILDDPAALSPGSEPLHAISLLELCFFIGQRLLRDTDAASMAVSLEVRVPLLDHEVVEQAARIAPDRRFEPLGRKMLLRELGMPNLDPAMFDRPKAGFVLPIELWCRQALKDEVARTLADEDLCASAGLNPHAVGALWRSFQADAPGLYWSRVWSLFSLLWWCRRHKVSL